VAAFARVPPAPARQDPNIRDVPDGNLTVVRVQADGNCFFRALAQSHTFNQGMCSVCNNVTDDVRCTHL
jgi:hypothetical protein